LTYALLDTKKDEKHILIALMMIGSFPHTSAQTTPEKVSEKTTELNEVAIIRTKKQNRKQIEPF
jgi:hypothetical protein